MSDSGRSPDPATERYERLLGVHRVMVAVAREIGPALELDRVLQIVLGAMRSLVEFHGGMIWLTDDGGIYLAAVDPPIPDADPTVRIPVGSGVTGRIVAGGQAIYVADLDADPAEHHAVAPTPGSPIASYLGVPLVVLGDVIGVLAVESSHRDAFDAHDQVLLEGLAAQVAGAIESARRFEKVAELEVLKSDFIARVSHELRTPITIMSGFVSTLLAHHDELAADQRRVALERVDAATSRLSGLIDELLMLSKLEAGVVSASREPVIVRELLDQVRRESTNADLVLVDCADDVKAETDPALLVRALGFLVDNALKYAGAAELHGRHGEIAVIDHGPGIRAEAKATVFERFTRDTDQTTVPGMGIGLPMARTLLAAIGAELLLEDTEGGGARMVVSFRD